MRDLIVKKGIPYSALVCALILGWNWAFPKSDAKAKLADIKARSHAAMMELPGRQGHKELQVTPDLKASPAILAPRAMTEPLVPTP